MYITLNNIQYVFDLISLIFYIDKTDKLIKLELTEKKIEEINNFINNLNLNNKINVKFNQTLSMEYTVTNYYLDDKLILILKESRI